MSQDSYPVESTTKMCLMINFPIEACRKAEVGAVGILYNIIGNSTPFDTLPLKRGFTYWNMRKYPANFKV